MDPEQFEAWLIDEIEHAVDKAVDDAAKELASVTRQLIPLNRHKTRKAVQYFKRVTSRGYHINLRLKFQTKYPSQGTPTERAWRKAWTRSNATFRQSFSRHLNRSLEKV